LGDVSVDLDAALAVEHAAVGDRERARSEPADHGHVPCYGRARAGDDHIAGDEDVGGLQRTAVGDRKRAVFDLDIAADGE
jgi:hypothetical protein